MKAIRPTRALLLGALAAVLLPAACDAGGIVGGDCREGAVQCGDRCVDLLTDSENCGECARVCDLGEACIGGECTEPQGRGGASGSSGQSGEAGLGGAGAGSGGDFGGDAGSSGDGTGGSDSTGGDGGTGGTGTAGTAGTGGTGTAGTAGTGGTGTAGTAGTGGTGTAGTAGTGGTGTAGTAGTGGTGTAGTAGTGGTGTAGTGGTGGTSGQAGTSGFGGEAGATCVEPFNTAEQCGDCETQCEEPNPVCAPKDGGGYECRPFCDLPLERCGNQCVNKSIDYQHCGECFNVCESGICQAAVCVGASTGHIAAYCMDYSSTTRPPAHRVLLGNSVFLAIANRVRVLGFSRWTPATTRARVNEVISSSAIARGRTWTLDLVSDAADLTSELSIQNYDVLLVYDQPNAPSGELAALGTTVATNGVLDSFARAGGVIVVLNGAQGTAEMDQFIDAAGLLDLEDAGGHTAILPADNATFYVRGPADALATNVVSQLLPITNSCVFETPVTPTSQTVFVVTDNGGPAVGSPVVVHRIVDPP